MGTTLPCCKEKDEPSSSSFNPVPSETELHPSHAHPASIPSQETPITRTNLRSVLESTPKSGKNGSCP